MDGSNSCCFFPSTLLSYTYTKVSIYGTKRGGAKKSRFMATKHSLNRDFAVLHESCFALEKVFFPPPSIDALSLSRFPPFYFLSNSQECFELSSCVGVIGGRPNHALYFIGHGYDDQLICLDPHTTQQALKSADEALLLEEDQSLHMKRPSRLPMQQLDPSLALVSKTPYRVQMCNTMQ